MTELVCSSRAWCLPALLALVILLAVGCGASQPAAVDTAGITRDELRDVVQEAVATSETSGVTAAEVEVLVAKAVEDAAASGLTADEVESLVAKAVAVADADASGVTAAEVEASVGRAVAEALAAQQDMQPAAQDDAGPIVLTDIVGRTVTIERPVERIILGEARQIYIAAALQPGNPFNKIVGWRDDLRRFDGDTYKKYLEKFPEAANIEEFGSPYSGEFSVERAIALEADVVTLNLGGLERAQEAGMIDQLAEVGIPVVVIDYRQEPLENTVPSTILMGRLLGQEERAQEIVDFYLQQVNAVYSRVAQIEVEDKPVAFIEPAAGINSASECCRTWGEANMGLLIERAGGVNMGSELIPGWSGTLNPEQILVADPDLIIVTGSNWYAYIQDGDFVSLGYFTAPADARESLAGLADKRSGWNDLQSVGDGRLHAVWHQFYNSPYHFVALQYFAKWLYPEEFADMDPAANFAEFHRRFLPVDYSGVFALAVGE